MSNVLVGTSSWTDKSLIDSGRFYPAAVRTPEDRLRYYAAQFPIVEIDSSYYGIPIEQNTRLWVERTPPDFVFNIKAYRLFTRHQTPVASLAKDIRAALGPVDKANVYDEDMPAEIQLELWRQSACSRSCGEPASSAPCISSSRRGSPFIQRASTTSSTAV